MFGILTVFSISEGEKLEKLYEEAKEAYPDYLGVHVSYLLSVDSHTDPKK